MAVAGVALSRVRLGARWPSDVIVGFLIGVTMLVAAEQLLMSRWAAKRCHLLKRHPG